MRAHGHCAVSAGCLRQRFRRLHHAENEAITGVRICRQAAKQQVALPECTALTGVMGPAITIERCGSRILLERKTLYECRASWRKPLSMNVAKYTIVSDSKAEDHGSLIFLPAALLQLTLIKSSDTSTSGRLFTFRMKSLGPPPEVSCTSTLKQNSGIVAG